MNETAIARYFLINNMKESPVRMEYKDMAVIYICYKHLFFRINIYVTRIINISLVIMCIRHRESISALKWTMIYIVCVALTCIVCILINSTCAYQVYRFCYIS